MTLTLQTLMLQDLSVLFDLGGLTTPVAYHQAAAPNVAIPLQGIFDEAYQEVDAKSRMPIGSVGPAVHLMASSLPGEIDDEDRLVINGKTYRIVTPKPDGQGTVLCRLHRVGA